MRQQVHRSRCQRHCLQTAAGKQDRQPQAVAPGQQNSSSSSSSSSKKRWQWDESENALWAYLVLFGILAAGQAAVSIPSLRSIPFKELPYFVGLAATTIYIGAHRGLTTRLPRQQISIKQGLAAPLFASVALFGGYLLVKNFPALTFQVVLDAYFWLVGSFALAGGLAQPLRRLAGSWGGKDLDFPVPKWLVAATVLEEDQDPHEEGEEAKPELPVTDLIALVIGISAASYDVVIGHDSFTLCNLLACVIATDIMQALGLRSFRAAGVALVGLLLYDVFWVFGSPKVIGENVMMTVATSDIRFGPARLLYPRLVASASEGGRFPYSLLGLGDVAVPGLLACLALRFDAVRLLQPGQAAGTETSAQAGGPVSPTQAQTSAATAGGAVETVTTAVGTQKPVLPVTEAILQNRTYFLPLLAAYIVGLGVAFAANSITKLGQPALLYLVPLTLGSIALTAATKGELGRVFSFTDSASTLPPLRGNKKDKGKGSLS
ncbi:hypothetical protein WJX74_003621 [Apatococcus lobatus]|uniref:Signal peptide peptidase n=1 Tax=Apatococcus lobatus TaxID=904363 RepID=A0AAW1QUA2_9CHLO